MFPREEQKERKPPMENFKYIVLDTETTDLVEKQDDKVDPTNALTYNIGWAVVDAHTGMYEKRSFIVKEVMFAMREQMRRAFYANKIPLYWDMVGRGTIEVVSLFDIYAKLMEDVENYKVKAIVAHNARFDVCALNNTLRVLTESRSLRFLPNVEIWDTMKMANSTIAKQTHYKKFCEENGFMTKHATPRPRLTAEVLYRYIMNDPTFEEEHTALADVEIEALIFQKCFATHKKMDRVLYPAD